jgi:hypothetical protein
VSQASTLRTCSRNLEWKMLNQLEHIWPQMVIWIGMLEVNQLIKRCIGLWLEANFILTSLRPDVMFSICICTRFQASPKKSHLTAVKRTLRYLRHTPSVGLWYHKGSHLSWLVTQTRIMRETRWIKRVHRAHVSCFEDHLYRSPQRSKTLEFGLALYSEDFIHCGCKNLWHGM